MTFSTWEDMQAAARAPVPVGKCRIYFVSDRAPGTTCNRLFGVIFALCPLKQRVYVTAHDFEDTVDCDQQLVFRDARTDRTGQRVEFVTSQDLAALPFSWDYLYVEKRVEDPRTRVISLAIVCMMLYCVASSFV